MQTEKVFVPKSYASEVVFKDGSSLINLEFHADTLADFVRNHANQGGYVKFKLSRLREPRETKSGKLLTHSISLDTWQPTKTAGQAFAPAKAAVAKAATDNVPDDVPF